MKIVLDANIFVSAFIWGGKPRLITNRYVQMSDTLFISDDIMNEIKYVLRMPKFDLNKRRFDDIIENFGMPDSDNSVDNCNQRSLII